MNKIKNIYKHGQISPKRKSYFWAVHENPEQMVTLAHGHSQSIQYSQCACLLLLKQDH